MFESGRLDLDRMAQERLDPDLILGVDFRSGGHDLMAHGVAAGLAGDVLPRRRGAGVRRFRPSGGGFEWDLGQGASTQSAWSTWANIWARTVLWRRER